MEQVLNWRQYLLTAAETVAEGIVMLKNDRGALPLRRGEQVAVFGRAQLHYYKSGTGSGGMVNVSHVTGIPEGLQKNGITLDEEVLSAYTEWDKENPYDSGSGWGGEPWSQKEMPVDGRLVRDAANRCRRAIVIIGRTAGEEQDNRNRDILRRLKEIDAPAELKEEVRDAVAQNADTVLVLIDEVRRVYPDYRLYPACEVERLIDILEIIACAGGPMVRGLIQDLFRDWPIGPRETNYYRKDGKDYREKQGRP